MATSPLISKTHHVRSISLPSRPHPFMPHCDELLSRFSASEAVSSSLSSISNKLAKLKDLNDCVDDLLQLPENQQALSQESHLKCVNGMLDGSLRLLDICGAAKDALLQNKESIHELQSSLRRRSGNENEIAKEAAMYLTQRRMIKKATRKAIRHLKDMENISKDHENLSIVSLLRQVQMVTITVLESLMTIIAGQKGTSDTGKWSFVSKMMQSKHISGQEEETSNNEFEVVDASLKSLMDHKSNKTMSIENAQVLLEDLELSAQDLEEGVECLFRQLIKTRVSLLNILNH